VVVSGGLDEWEIERLCQAGAPIDGFGVGRSLATSADAPTVDAVYKLVAFDGRPVRKTSPGKETWPGAKQVWRADDWSGDVLGLHGESSPGGHTPLLEPVMVAGRRTVHRSVAEAAQRFDAQRAALPAGVRRLSAPDRWPVAVSEALRAATSGGGATG
jgi:nicotinate phosphoribosyltransferase